ncbi:hypothetical protein Y1Q_0005514 [Alligator mississippiensis]|uniref:Reverse transcriptase/retrotransposon-derived protein RNase H-like domain-containing protein n=1 Tax=Alligator mississippiensis TaxID=8496 RepID=A0A151MF81_ALLMI|nr:hypothetical protein Y1Q_0005514 [Alligator mississippiensis]
MGTEGLQFRTAQEEDDELQKIREIQVARIEEEIIWPKVDTDASEMAVGAVLCQEQEGIECSIAYASQKLNAAETRDNFTPFGSPLLVCATGSNTSSTDVHPKIVETRVCACCEVLHS